MRLQPASESPTSPGAGNVGADSLLEVRGLRKEFARSRLADKLIRKPASRTLALDDVSLAVRAGETVGIVGESGSGKTTLARILVRLVDADAGSVRFHDEDILNLRGANLASVRRRMQLIYQDPYSSLNPAMTVGATIAEPAVVHGLVDKGGVEERVADLMSQVGLSASLSDRRPGALSGGQRQRVAIARSLAAQPEVLIADEAVSALDVSIQAQILHLFARLQRELGLTLIFVSHQLATVAQLCERVVIMYRGQIVEAGPTAEVFARPRHGYTHALLQAHPGQGRLRDREDAPVISATEAPALGAPGCPFRHRCAFAIDTCATETPARVRVAPDHVASCPVLAGDGAQGASA